MIARFIWLATLAGMLLVGNAAMAQEGDAASQSEEERLRRVLDHSAEETVQLEITLPLAIQFDSEGSDPFPENVREAETIKLAATYYAISTLDFSVSPQELIDSGFWPVTHFPAGIDMHKPLGNIPGSSNQSSGKKTYEFMVQGANSPGWLADARRDILLGWYHDQDFEELVRDFDSYELAPAFWTNPYTGKAMQESDQPGDFEQIDAEQYRIVYRTQAVLDLVGNAELKLPLMNYVDRHVFFSRPGVTSNNIQTNSDYDKQYRDQTRSAPPEAEDAETTKDQ
ncbi:hypothetical protein KDL29_11975 [bacterium]|nr:hypothetical protein [bacterium]